MTKIEIKEGKNIQPKELERLFLSVGWSSGYYPEKLSIAIKNSSSVFSAWVDGQLIGLVNAFDDGIMNAYIHYLLVDPDFQHIGLGHELLSQMRDYYKDYLRIVLIAYEKESGFYQRNGFEIGKETVPMFMTTRWT